MCLDNDVSGKNVCIYSRRAYAVPKRMDGVRELILSHVNTTGQCKCKIGRRSLEEVIVMVSDAKMARVLVSRII